MAPKEIPQDVIDCIVNELPDDVFWLKQYSLVARSFVYPCQKRLLPASVISLGCSIEQCSTFHRMLLESPHIARYIQRLTLCVDFAKKPYYRACHPSELHGPTLPKILDMLSALKYLSVETSHTNVLRWIQLSTPLKSSLLKLFKSTQLAELRIKYAELPADVFSESFHLKSLYLPNCQITAPHTPVTPTRRPKLQAFTVESSGGKDFGPNFEALSLVFDFSHLRDLRLTTNDAADLYIIKKLFQLSVTLESFTWTALNTCQHQDMSLVRVVFATLRIPPNLVHLTIGQFEGDSIDKAARLDTSCLWAIEALRALRDDQTAKLETLTIQLSTTTLDQRNKHFLPHKYWEFLQTILMTHGSFSRLRRVTIAWYVFTGSIEDYQAAWADEIIHHMPKLHQQGILEVTLRRYNSGSRGL